jgi:hypothetical protein
MTKILRVFPRRTSYTPNDDMVIVCLKPKTDSQKKWGVKMPIILPAADEVHISVTFTWDREWALFLQKAWLQYYPVVRVGGPAFSSSCDLFIPGLYVKQGVTFTSHGCNHQCPWCLVPEREGRLSLCPSFPAGWIENDNNVLQCPIGHWHKVVDMLRTQRDIEMAGGLEADLMTQEKADDLKSLHVHQLFFACDTRASLKALQRAGALFHDDTHQRLRCFVLLAYGGQTISQATAHLEDVWAAGFVPHAQLYQPVDRWIEYPKEWTDLARRWTRPAIMRRMNGKDTPEY